MGSTIGGAAWRTRAAPSEPADAGLALPSPGADAAPSRPGEARPRVPNRSAATRRLLGRLRDELGRIVRAPASPAEALREIADAMTRGALGGWSLPSLDAPGHVHHDDGTISIALISHVIVLNPWGAFRIVDCLQPVPIYFETSGAPSVPGGRSFRLPARGIGGVPVARVGCDGLRLARSSASPPRPSFRVDPAGRGGSEES